MAKKRIQLNGQGDVVETEKIKTYKAKPKPYKSDIIENYMKERDRLFWLEGNATERALIEERWIK